MRNTVITIAAVTITIICFILAHAIDKSRKRIDKLEKVIRVDEWHLQWYQYVLTLKDDDWVEVRHSDGGVVGLVKIDSTSQLGKLFIKDNE